MTNQEAITAIRSNWPTSNYTVLIEALEMAIKSLERDCKECPVGGALLRDD